MHAQSCPTLWDSKDCSPPGSSVHGLSQARILEGVVISFSRRSSQPRDQTPYTSIADGLFTAEPPGKKTPSSPPVTATNWWSAAAWVTH